MFLNLQELGHFKGEKMKVYRLWFPYKEEYGRLYLKKGAAKGAIKTGRYLWDKKKDIEIHEFEMYDEPNVKLDSNGEEKK